MTALLEVTRRFRGRAMIGVAVSRDAVRLVAVNRAGLLVWNRSLSRGRGDVTLAELVGKGLTERPASLRRPMHIACVVGPTEAQLRPLHGLPQLRTAAEQLAVVAESVDRFFVSEGARMRVSAPVRLRAGELWAAAVSRDVVAQVAEACRAHRMRLVGVAPVAAALGHLAAWPRAATMEGAPAPAHVQHVDDGTRLHVLYDAGGLPTRVWRERAPAGTPALEGDVRLPDRLGPTFADAYAATQLRARDPFVIGEHSDAVRRARLARVRTWLWAGLAAAGLIAAAWAPGAIATKRGDLARTRLASLARRQEELRLVQATLGTSSAALNTIASFEASRRSATLLLAELAMTLPDSTAITTLRVDSVGGTLTLLAPRAAAALEAVSALPLVARVQLAGAVTREVTGGVELERASLRFAFQRRRGGQAAVQRDSVSRLAVAAPRDTAASTIRILGASPKPGRVPAPPVLRGATQ
ncbi:MAG TPA: hypothetical protein VFS59_11940 [Gemmatimonadaceae bacterium]|nr:hypothetical protein [Gemmatimonadaceae bacterium]